MGVHKLGCAQACIQLLPLCLFISHPSDSDSLLIVVCMGVDWGSSPGRQETPDAAGHSVFLTCVNGLTNQCDSSRVVILFAFI